MLLLLRLPLLDLLLVQPLAEVHYPADRRVALGRDQRGTYVLGLEPANCGVGGRAQDRAEGVLRVLAPGETEALVVEIGVLPDEEAVEGWKRGSVKS